MQQADGEAQGPLTRASVHLIEITLARPSQLRLGSFPVRMRRLIVSAEDQTGLVAALNPKLP